MEITFLNFFSISIFFLALWGYNKVRAHWVIIIQYYQGKLFFLFTSHLIEHVHNVVICLEWVFIKMWMFSKDLQVYVKRQKFLKLSKTIGIL